MKHTHTYIRIYNYMYVICMCCKIYVCIYVFIFTVAMVNFVICKTNYKPIYAQHHYIHSTFVQQRRDK